MMGPSLLAAVLLSVASSVVFERGFRLVSEESAPRSAPLLCFGADEIEAHMRSVGGWRRPRNVVQFCAPSFLVIGFGRCGTTSLSKYLDKHPRISFGTRKEHFYFYRPEFCDLQHGANDRPTCDVRAYASQFPVLAQLRSKNFTFDATPMLGGDMGVPAGNRTMAWLRSNLPGLKLIVLVKSPADRFMSNPLASAKIGRLQDSLLTGDNVMPHKLRQLMMDNCYIDKLDKWFRHFERSRFFLIRSEDLRILKNRQKILDSLTDFLGVERFKYPLSQLDVLENFHNSSLHPRARAVVNCLPKLKECERRLEDSIDFPDPVVPWCKESSTGQTLVSLKSSRPPIFQPTTPADGSDILRLKNGADDGQPSAAATTTKRVAVLGWKEAIDNFLKPRALKNSLVLSSQDPKLFVVGVARPSFMLWWRHPEYWHNGKLRDHLSKAPKRSLPRKLKTHLLEHFCLADTLKPLLQSHHPSSFIFLPVSDDSPDRLSHTAITQLNTFLGLEHHHHEEEEEERDDHLPSRTLPDPITQRALDCHPTIVACEHRLDAALMAPPRGWCRDARARARTLGLS